MTDQEQKMLQAGIDAYAQKLNEANSALQVAVNGFNALAGIANQEQQGNGKVESDAEIIQRLLWKIRLLQKVNQRMIQDMGEEDHLLVIDTDGNKQPLWVLRLRHDQKKFESERVFRLA